MKAKLQGYLCYFPTKAVEAVPQNNFSVNVSNINEINIMLSFEQAKQLLQEQLRPGDLLLTMGAGDVYKVGEQLLAEQESQRQK